MALSLRKMRSPSLFVHWEARTRLHSIPTAEIFPEVPALTSDRAQVLRAVRSTVAGDEAALYNTLLLTLKDATQYKGRKVVVVFSNGPDNSSVVPPEDVAEFAQSAGVSIYMISTQEARLEPVSTAVFDRMTAATGGKAYFAKNWRDEKRAFASIRDDLAHLYSLSYYPKANPNSGWRAITVKLVGEQSEEIQDPHAQRVPSSAVSVSQRRPNCPAGYSSVQFVRPACAVWQLSRTTPLATKSWRCRTAVADEIVPV